MCDHDPRRQSGWNIANHRRSDRTTWPASNPIHLTDIDLHDVSSDSNPKPAELPTSSIHKESEEKSEPNGCHRPNDPDNLLPSDLANLELKPRRNSHHRTGFQRIDPKMGHVKRVCLTADDVKCKDYAKDKTWTKVVLQHPQACNNRLQESTDTHDVIWDSGASVCITNDKNDFIGPVKKTQNGKANGISGAMGITGSGKVRWSLIDAAGEV